MNGLGQNTVLRARVAALSLVTIGIVGARPPLRWTMALATLGMAIGGMEIAAGVRRPPSRSRRRRQPEHARRLTAEAPRAPIDIPVDVAVGAVRPSPARRVAVRARRPVRRGRP